MRLSSGGSGGEARSTSSGWSGESSAGLQSVTWACRGAEDRLVGDERGLAAIMAALSASDNWSQMARPSEEMAFQVGSGNVALG